VEKGKPRLGARKGINPNEHFEKLICLHEFFLVPILLFNYGGNFGTLCVIFLELKSTMDILMLEETCIFKYNLFSF
jgi:hypothetical protein